MEIVLLAVGNTSTEFISKGIEEYLKRLKHYIRYTIEIIPDIKKTKALNSSQQKELEGRNILSYITLSDYIILLDEHGKQMKSVDFSVFLQKLMSIGKKRIVFIVGGPYGFSQDIYDRANYLLSLSKMTFSHEMVRLFFTEQVYRAMTILRGEPYHHE